MRALKLILNFILLIFFILLIILALLFTNGWTYLIVGVLGLIIQFIFYLRSNNIKKLNS